MRCATVDSIVAVFHTIHTKMWTFLLLFWFYSFFFFLIYWIHGPKDAQYQNLEYQIVSSFVIQFVFLFKTHIACVYMSIIFSSRKTKEMQNLFIFLCCDSQFLHFDASQYAYILREKRDCVFIICFFFYFVQIFFTFWLKVATKQIAVLKRNTINL